jgi:hypothetical protein
MPADDCCRRVCLLVLKLVWQSALAVACMLTLQLQLANQARLSSLVVLLLCLRCAC